MKVCIPKNQRSKCRWSARSHVFIWITTIFISVYFQTWFPVFMILLPNFYGKTLIMLLGLTQHAGLQEDIKDHRLTTRSVYLNPIFSFLYWHMEYHVEHHIYPQVPSYNLKKLHILVKDQMPKPRKGLLGAGVVPGLIKQAKIKLFSNYPSVETFTIVKILGGIIWSQQRFSY